MPTIIIELLEGRTVEQKRKLAEAITKDVCEILDMSKEFVTIIYHDSKYHDLAKAGVLASDRTKK
ncbi:MAG: tautomerase family protein [archaeon]